MRKAALPLLVLAAASLSSGGCVSQGRYDEVVTKASAEAEQRKKLEGRVEALNQQRERAEGKVGVLEAELAEARLEADVAQRERETAEATVQQLRVELSRVGEHIRHFANRNTELEQVGDRLSELERDVEHRLATLAELTRRLGDLPASSGVLITVKDGYPAVRFAAGSAVSSRGLNKEAKRAVAALADVLEEQPGSEIVALHGGGDDPSRSVAEVIAEAVSAKHPATKADVLEADGIEKGVAFVIIRRAGARPTVSADR